MSEFRALDSTAYKCPSCTIKEQATSSDSILLPIEMSSIQVDNSPDKVSDGAEPYSNPSSASSDEPCTEPSEEPSPPFSPLSDTTEICSPSTSEDISPVILAGNGAEVPLPCPSRAPFLPLAPDQNQPLERDIFYVESIVKHYGSPGRRDFLVRWSGYDSSENTWMAEEDLTSCSDMVYSYCRQKKLPPSNLPLIGGADGEIDISDNWSSINDVLSLIRQLSANRPYYNTLWKSGPF